MSGGYGEPIVLNEAPDNLGKLEEVDAPIVTAIMRDGTIALVLGPPLRELLISEEEGRVVRDELCRLLGMPAFGGAT